MSITITDPYAAMAAGFTLLSAGLGIYLITCAIGLALAIRSGNADN